jgi:hypothetical protein
MTSSDVYLKFISIPGWPPERFRDWLLRALAAQLLR